MVLAGDLWLKWHPWPGLDRELGTGAESLGLRRRLRCQLPSMVAGVAQMSLEKLGGL